MKGSKKSGFSTIQKYVPEKKDYKQMNTSNEQSTAEEKSSGRLPLLASDFTNDSRNWVSCQILHDGDLDGVSLSNTVSFCYLKW